MVSEELKAIIDKLNEQGKMIFLESATEEQISQAVSLPLEQVIALKDELKTES